MLLSILYQIPTIVIVIIVLSLMMLFLHIGHITRKRKIARDPSSVELNLSAIESSLLGLLALLLAFTFSMSASRYDERLNMAIDEANAIRTAVFRADMYPDSIRKEFRNYFKEYVEARIGYYQVGADDTAIARMIVQTEFWEQKIWSLATAQSQNDANIARTQQMIPALNAMIGMITTREELREATVSDFIFWLLFLLCFAASFMVGYTLKGQKKDPYLIWIFGIMTSLTLYLIIDLDRPRRGIINTAAANEKIIDLRKMFKEIK